MQKNASCSFQDPWIPISLSGGGKLSHVVAPTLGQLRMTYYVANCRITFVTRHIPYLGKEIPPASTSKHQLIKRNILQSIAEGA